MKDLAGAHKAYEYDISKIRNFCIIAHIDHGKSTLADRLIEYTCTVAQRDMKSQLLDSMVRTSERVHEAEASSARKHASGSLRIDRGTTGEVLARGPRFLVSFAQSFPRRLLVFAASRATAPPQDLERERGITIKLNAARMEYLADDGEVYLLNLIDTPGHVDFQYEVRLGVGAEGQHNSGSAGGLSRAPLLLACEPPGRLSLGMLRPGFVHCCAAAGGGCPQVSRSLAACEGALLVVDASQGIEAQTLANCYLAVDADLAIIPVLNKIDLPAADPDRVSEEIEASIGLDCTDAVHCSAKAGIGACVRSPLRARASHPLRSAAPCPTLPALRREGIREVLEAVVRTVPPPATRPGGEKAPLRALIYDSLYESYRGVIVSFRVVDGCVRKGDKILFMNSKAQYEVAEVGVMLPEQRKAEVLRPGEVGYLCAAIKSVQDARVGDTVTVARSLGARTAEEALPGYAQAVPTVYCGLFPVDADQYELLRESLGRLSLNDAALQFEPESSSAMGFGFRCGFLGLLHMEIVQERLEREYALDLIVTAPSVVYEHEGSNGETTLVDNPAKMPEPEGKNSEVRKGGQPTTASRQAFGDLARSLLPRLPPALLPGARAVRADGNLLPHGVHGIGDGARPAAPRGVRRN